MRGVIESVDIAPADRAFLAADAAAGATTVQVQNGYLFAGEAPEAIFTKVDGSTQTVAVTSVVFGDGEEAVDTLTLAAGLSEAAVDGDPVDAVGAPLMTTATVILDGELDVVEATVDQSLQGKVDLQEGYYDEGSRPVVDVSLIDGIHFIVGVNGRGADDGSYIDPSTLPPSPDTDPVAPSSSPTPTVRGFAGVLLALWDGISNPTPVMYDVHVSPSNSSAPSSSTLLDSVASTIESIRTLADTTPLAYDTDYFVAIVARSGDQYAAPSPWVGPTRMDRTRSADLAADAIDGKTITGATVRTASGGMRTQLDEVGLRTFAADGTTETSRLSAEEGGMRLGGDLNADGRISSKSGGTGYYAALDSGGLHGGAVGMRTPTSGLIFPRQSGLQTNPTFYSDTGAILLGGAPGRESQRLRIGLMADGQFGQDAVTKGQMERLVDRRAAPVVTNQPIASPFGGGSGAFINAVRVGDIVTVNVNVSRASGSSTAYTRAATLPVGWRPPVAVPGGASAWFNTTQTYQWVVFDDGTVSGRMSAANSNAMSATIIYQTNDPYPA